MQETDRALLPREASRYICENSEHVAILSSGVDSVSEKLFEIVKNNKNEISPNRWKAHELLPQTRDDFAANWIFVSDLLNFSFWTEPNKKYVVHYKGKDWTGYWSLCAAIWRSIDEGLDVTDPHIYSGLSMKELMHIFRSDSEYEIPLLEERLHCLHTAGKVLIEKYNGTFMTFLKSCHSATELVKKIVNEFESFRDEVEFKGKKVAILKRAQILVGDLWACFGGEEICNFSDISEITAFADYRVPQVLVWLGAMKYSDELNDLLKKDVMLPYGHKMEVEIRGSTIHCVDMIVTRTNQLLSNSPLSDTQLNPIIVDHFLWDLRRQKDGEINDVPFHKTRSIYY